jgi:uncharacterized protein with NRDE domain
MCLIAFALDYHPRYSLVLAANRDEFLDRETEPAGFWRDAPHLLAGRDRLAGGTWLGVTTAGKLAAVTNYRDPRQQVADPPSRGALVADYLRDGKMTAADLHAQLFHSGNSYDGFNLIYGTFSELHYFTNRGGSSGPITPGIHALSNHLLDTRWPKLVEAKNRLKAILQQEEPGVDELFKAMADPTPFADELLPDTGIGPEFERFLSPIFIRGERYATRSTTVLLVSRSGEVTFCEQSHDAPGLMPLRFEFRAKVAA